jgi:hypothetical protein
MRRSNFSAVLAAAAATTTLPCESVVASSSAPARFTRVRLGYIGNVCEAVTVTAPTSLAFLNERLAAERTRFESEEALIVALHAGTIDAASMNLPILIEGLDRGCQVRVAAGLHTGCMSMLARDAFAFYGPRDLKGQTIGTDRFDGPAMHLLMAILAKQGLDPHRDVKWRGYSSGELDSALQAHVVNCVAVSDPIAYELQTAHRAEAYLDSAGGGFSCGNDIATGHHCFLAAVGDWAVIGVGADVLHMLSAAAWIGVLAAALSFGSDGDVRRITPVAGFAVVAIVLTGIVQTVRNVGSFSPLLSSAYGLAIDLKIGLLALTLLAALAARQALKRGRHAFQNPIRLELLVLTGVTAVTAVLVETPLPREAATLPPVSASFAVSQVTVHVSATPSDPLHWTLYIDGTDARGDPRALDGAVVTLRDADRNSGPLVVPLTRSASGAFTGDAALPWRGSWSALISARVGEFDENHRTLSLKENRP